MPINNLNNAHYSEAKKTAIKAALTVLENELSDLNSNLTPEERQLYGSVNEQHKLFINKDYDFHQDSPELSSSDVDWDEFALDKESRLFKEGVMTRLDALQLRVQNSKIMHDYDNYQAALDDYAYTSYKAGANLPGFETKYNELKQFFMPRNKNKPPTGEKP